MRKSERGLSMNLRLHRCNLLLHMQQKFVVTGSWFRCAIRKPWTLSLNRLPVAASRQSAADCYSHELRRSAESPLGQGSWSQCPINWRILAGFVGDGRVPDRNPSINDKSAMKKILITLLSAALLATTAVFGQPAQPLRSPTSAGSRNSQPQDQNLVRFDLNFPGGTPRQLVEAIEKASGRPLNAIIPDEEANLKLPQLKMRSVTAPELFDALTAASVRSERHLGGDYKSIPGGGIGRAIETFQIQYGFKTNGKPNDDSVWYFYAYNFFPVVEARACRFWQLSPYLETYKVEDITTAIQTGWKMLGEEDPPTISFHKDTKLLIAVGEESKLRMIDSVLQQLAQGKPQPQRESSGAKSAEPAKK